MDVKATLALCAIAALLTALALEVLTHG